MSKTRIFIIDDSAMFRRIIKESINDFVPNAIVSGSAPNGIIAIQKIKHTPSDLLLIDIYMPQMDGIETLKKIKKEFPNLKVVMISGSTTADANITINALEEGALDFIHKGSNKGSIEKNKKFIASKISEIISVIESVKENKKISELEANNITSTLAFKDISTEFSLIVIGSSCGGPKALHEIIPKLNADLGCPVLLVQHMPPVFTKTLAKHLDQKSKLTVKEASLSGEVIRKNHVYIAPGGKHMTIIRSFDQENLQILLKRTPYVHSCRPAIDVLFKSVAKVYTKPVLSVILTGMGCDGADGVAALKASIPCLSIAQSKNSCVVYGMPKVVIERKLADRISPLQSIPNIINTIFKNKANSTQGALL